MAKLMKMLQPLQSEYVDRRYEGTKEEYFRSLELSSTLYIGNLSFYTTDDQLYELFGKVGSVARVIVGLDRNTKTPCGFCFVIYHTRADALAAVRHLNGTKLDNRQLRVDIDYGFEEGRQYGRGRSGGQVRDEFRTDYDADRGGFGRLVAQQVAAQQMAMWQEVQAGAMLGGGGQLPADGDGGGGDATAVAAAGGAVFFGQQQRVDAAQGQQAVGGQEQGAAGAGDGGDGEGAAAAPGVDPRMRGREEEDDEDDARRRNKRRRVGGSSAAEQQQQQQPGAGAEDDGGPAAPGDDDEMREGEDGGDEEAAAAGDDVQPLQEDEDD